MQQHPSEKESHQAAHKDAAILLDCPHCHSFISEKNLDASKKIAKCSYCDHVFSFDKEGYWDPFGLPTETQPLGLEMLRLPSFLEFKIDHYRTNTGIWPLIGFTFIWNLLLLFFIVPLLLSKQFDQLPFISVHLLAGLFMMWKVFAALFNRSNVHIDSHNICLATKPFKILNRSKCIPTSEVKQLSVESIRTVNSKGHTQMNHVLFLHKQSGDKIKLLEALDVKTLYYLEKEIERFLEIEDSSTGTN